MKNFLDRDPLVRDLVMTVVSAVVVWAGSSLVPWLAGHTGAAALLAPLVAVGVAAATPFTRAYGVKTTE